MIQLTQRAADHVHEMLDQRGYGIGLRLSLRKAGCSGFAYEVDYADQIDIDDIVFDSNDIKIVVSKVNLPYLDGTEVDFLSDNKINRGFEFHNPHAHDVCGCGESFNVE